MVRTREQYRVCRHRKDMVPTMTLVRRKQTLVFEIFWIRFILKMLPSEVYHWQYTVSRDRIWMTTDCKEHCIFWAKCTTEQSTVDYLTQLSCYLQKIELITQMTVTFSNRTFEWIISSATMAHFQLIDGGIIEIESTTNWCVQRAWIYGTMN